MKGIESRSRMLARRYTVSLEDMRQEGSLHLLEFKLKYPDAPFLQIMKSINYFYSDLEKKLRTRRRREIHIESIEDLPYEIENSLHAKIDIDMQATELDSMKGLAVDLILEGVEVDDLKKMLHLTDEEFRELKGE